MKEAPHRAAPLPDTPAPARHERILMAIRVLVAGLFHEAPDRLAVHQPFLEMGADSIIIVEAIRKIERQFGVKISVRQLFEELSTLDAVAGYIDRTLPPGASWEGARPEAPPPSPAPMPTPPLAAPVPALRFPEPRGDGAPQAVTDSVREQVVMRQLELMRQQLAVLGGSPLPTTAAIPAAAPPTLPPAAVALPAAAAAPPTVPKREGPKSEAPVISTPRAPFKTAAGPRTGPTEQQQRHLDALIARYTARTRQSKAFAEKHRPVLADSRAAVGFRFSTKEMLYPLVASRGEGARIWDLDGNEYLDLTMGFGVLLFGHQPPFVAEALRAEIERGALLGPRSSLVGEVAEHVAALTGHERVVFTNSGTEAVMTAMRLARAATGRTRIALFAGSYHGHADGTLGHPDPGAPVGTAVPIAPGIPAGVTDDLLVLDYADPASLDVLRAHAHTLAAVLVEPVQSRRPDLQPGAFLKALRTFTADTGIALIFDEMITGFRIHPGGAQAWFGVKADLATYGKIIGGGQPIGVVAGKADFLDGIDGGAWHYGDRSFPGVDTTFFGGTFCQHPLSMAAAHATLSYLREQGPGLQETLNARTARFAERLNRFFAEAEVPMSVVHFGSLFRFNFSGNLDLFFYHLLERGVYIWEWRSCFLSTAHTDADLELLFEAIRDSVDALRTGGFLPEPEGTPRKKP